MVSLANGTRRSGAYFFEDDSDEQTASDVAPLIHRPPANPHPTNQHSHIITGYLSAVEAIILISYFATLLGLTLWEHDYKPSSKNNETEDIYTLKDPDKFVAYFCMVHVAVWALVGIMDRVVQWRHQVIRRKGYLKFYRRMRNIRRIPFIIISIGNAAQLLFMALLYFCAVDRSWNYRGLVPVHILYIIVSLELIITLPCLFIYIAQTTIFNFGQHPPDVIQDTYSGPESPTASVSAVGFRDGEDLDELLERQADMIRYLQQHNANLGRRILELQAQSVD